MTIDDLSYTRNLAGVGMDAAIEQVREALAAAGFGILTDIDVSAVFAKKLGVDFGPYRILGACNPTLAHKGVSAAPGLGLLLPCNVVVREVDANTVEVSVIKPTAMFDIVDLPDLAAIAEAADAALKQAITQL